MMASVAAVRGIERASQGDLAELLRIAAELGMDADHIAAVIARESGWNPRAVNPLSRATGLIQWLPSTARKFGTTAEAIERMSTRDQLRLVGRYYQFFIDRRGRPITTLADAYLAVFAPDGMGKAEGAALYTAPSKAYEQNRAVDRDGDGVITVGDAVAPVAATLANARTRPRIEVRTSTSAKGSSAWGMVAFLAFLWAVAEWRRNAEQTRVAA